MVRGEPEGERGAVSGGGVEVAAELAAENASAAAEVVSDEANLENLEAEEEKEAEATPTLECEEGEPGWLTAAADALAAPPPVTVTDEADEAEPGWLIEAAKALASPELPEEATTAETMCGAIEADVGAIEADVEDFRSSKICGKEVVEYRVQARGRAEQRGKLVTSWHRYSEFRELNDSVAAELGIPATFPVSKGLIFTEAQKETRMRELQAFLQCCVAAAQTQDERGGAPANLLSFLFNPELSEAAEAVEVVEVETTAAWHFPAPSPSSSPTPSSSTPSPACLRRKVTSPFSFLLPSR